MENHGFDEVIGSSDAPFVNGLAATSGLAANCTSVAHPSLPNYLALTAGPGRRVNGIKHMPVRF